MLILSTGEYLELSCHTDRGITNSELQIQL